MSFVRCVATRVLSFIQCIPAFIIYGPLVSVVRRPYRSEENETWFLGRAICHFAGRFHVIRFSVRIETWFRFTDRVTRGELRGEVCYFCPGPAMIIWRVAGNGTYYFPCFLLYFSHFFFSAIRVNFKSFISYLGAMRLAGGAFFRFYYHLVDRNCNGGLAVNSQI